MLPVRTGDRLISKLSASTVAASPHTKRGHPHEASSNKG